jgi:hypothetical protein
LALLKIALGLHFRPRAVELGRDRLNDAAQRGTDDDHQNDDPFDPIADVLNR